MNMPPLDPESVEEPLYYEKEAELLDDRHSGSAPREDRGAPPTLAGPSRKRENQHDSMHMPLLTSDTEDDEDEVCEQEGQFARHQSKFAQAPRDDHRASLALPRPSRKGENQHDSMHMPLLTSDTEDDEEVGEQEVQFARHQSKFATAPRDDHRASLALSRPSTSRSEDRNVCGEWASKDEAQEETSPETPDLIRTVLEEPKVETFEPFGLLKRIACRAENSADGEDFEIKERETSPRKSDSRKLSEELLGKRTGSLDIESLVLGNAETKNMDDIVQEQNSSEFMEEVRRKSTGLLDIKSLVQRQAETEKREDSIEERDSSELKEKLPAKSTELFDIPMMIPDSGEHEEPLNIKQEVVFLRDQMQFESAPRRVRRASPTFPGLFRKRMNPHDEMNEPLLSSESVDDEEPPLGEEMKFVEYRREFSSTPRKIRGVLPSFPGASRKGKDRHDGMNMPLLTPDYGDDEQELEFEVLHRKYAPLRREDNRLLSRPSTSLDEDQEKGNFTDERDSSEFKKELLAKSSGSFEVQGLVQGEPEMKERENLIEERDSLEFKDESLETSTNSLDIKILFQLDYEEGKRDSSIEERASSVFKEELLSESTGSFGFERLFKEEFKKKKSSNTIEGRDFSESKEEVLGKSASLLGIKSLFEEQTETKEAGNSIEEVDSSECKEEVPAKSGLLEVDSLEKDSSAEEPDFWKTVEDLLGKATSSRSIKSLIQEDPERQERGISIEDRDSSEFKEKFLTKSGGPLDIESPVQKDLETKKRGHSTEEPDSSESQEELLARSKGSVKKEWQVKKSPRKESESEKGEQRVVHSLKSTKTETGKGLAPEKPTSEQQERFEETAGDDQDTQLEDKPGPSNKREQQAPTVNWRYCKQLKKVRTLIKGASHKIKVKIDKETSQLVIVESNKGRKHLVQREIDALERLTDSILFLNLLSYSRTSPLLKKKKFHIFFQYFECDPLLSYPPAYFTNEVLRRIFSQIGKALKYMHRNRIIHRNIRPETILINSQVDVKLADFTSAIFGPTATESGDHNLSNKFSAPEYLNAKGRTDTPYSFPVDYYSVGATLFYIKFRAAPKIKIKKSSKLKNASTSQATGQVEYEVKFPEPLDPDLTNLIKDLLHPVPDHRLNEHGYLSHPFFGGTQ